MHLDDYYLSLAIFGMALLQFVTGCAIIPRRFKLTLVSRVENPSQFWMVVHTWLLAAIVCLAITLFLNMN